MSSQALFRRTFAEHRHYRRPRIHRDRRGVAILVIVVLVMLISLAAYRYAFEMESEYRLTRLQEEHVQARLASWSGIELAVAMLEAPLQQRMEWEGVGAKERVYRRRLEESSGEGTPGRESDSGWQFALISPAPSSDANGSSEFVSLSGERPTAWTWGVENESAKLHIPTLVRWDRTSPGHFRTYLLTLPGVDEELADAWLEQLGIPSSTPRGAGGSPSAIDSGLGAESRSRERREHLDRIRMLWFGGDLNQNYQLDPFEIQLTERLARKEASLASTTAMNTASPQSLQPLRRFLTWHSGERQERPNGLPRIDLNQPNLQQLHRELMTILPGQMADFVIALRQFGPNNPTPVAPTRNPNAGVGKSTDARNAASASSSAPPKPSPTPGGASPTTSSRISGSSAQASNEAPSAAVAPNAWTPDFTFPSRYLLTSPLDLVDAIVTTVSPQPGPGTGSNATNSPKKTLNSPFSSDSEAVRNYLGILLENTATDSSPSREGRVDITSAPFEVLIGIPGVNANLAQRILQLRANATNPSEPIGTIAWLLQSGAVDLSQLRALEPFLTCRSDVYSVQSVGFRSNTAQSPVHRVTVTIDAKQIPARVHEQRVWHVWDRGFTSDALTGSAP